jgi:glycosyltransferase involved in cell wall biosynthesis
MPTVSASYMVKNEAEYLPFSIRSIYDAVDEIIVVDNGSTDDTVKIAQQFDKVRLYHSDAGDFSTLRNMTIDLAVGDWILVMCADEVFYEDINTVLPDLVRDQGADSYMCWFYHLMRSVYYMQNSTDQDPLYHRIFLFRNTPGAHYVKPVHQYLTGIGPNTRESNLHYVHYGYVKPLHQIHERWRQYARLEGTPGMFDHLDTLHLLDDRPLYPFMRQHPPVIRDYIAAKAQEMARRGEKLYEKPPWISDHGVSQGCL